jgi:hypothetical protein
MYRDRLWTMRQFAGFASPEDINERYRYLIENGSTGLSMTFYLPGQLGRDSDDPLCGGEVGCTGIPIELREGFFHLLGHDVGVEVHEASSLGRTRADELVAGDVLAVDPGLYCSHIGSVRLEDLVLVTEDGSRRSRAAVRPRA